VYLRRARGRFRLDIANIKSVSCLRPRSFQKVVRGGAQTLEPPTGDINPFDARIPGIRSRLEKHPNSTTLKTPSSKKIRPFLNIHQANPKLAVKFPPGMTTTGRTISVGF